MSGHYLRVARRCLREDLAVADQDLDLTLNVLSERFEVVKAFLAQRSQNPEGQEVLTGLKSRIVAFTLHAGRFRGLTWHQQRAAIVWLLAVGYHRGGSVDDAYQHFRDLDARGQLLPTNEDVEAHRRALESSFAHALLEEIPPLVNEARSEPGRIVEGVIGGRIRIRVVIEGAEPATMTVAISQRLLPGALQLPAGWSLVVAAGFLPDTKPEHLAVAFDLSGFPLASDEIAFCDFIE